MLMVASPWQTSFAKTQSEVKHAIIKTMFLSFLSVNEGKKDAGFKIEVQHLND
jgi:hypothetical protein